MKPAMSTSRLLALPIALSLALAACAPAPQSTGTPDTTPAATPAPTSSFVLGKAFLDEPLVGATLRVRGLDGQLIHEASEATNAEGYFTLSAPTTLPRDFRVEVSGGTRGGVASDLVLKADVRGYNPVTDRVYVNAATTLVASKLDQTPSASLVETQAAVARFLKLPEDLSLGADLDNAQLRAFNHGKFMEVAAAQGGFAALIASMTGQISATSTTDHDFSIVLLDGIATSIALEIGKGALGKIGGTAMGWALESYFGIDDGAAERHKEVLKEFAGVRSQLTQMSNQIVELQSSVDAIKASIAALEKQMNKQFGLAAYNSKLDTMIGPVSTIDTLFDTYMDEIKRTDAGNGRKQRIEDLAAEIRSKVPTALTSLHSSMLGIAGGDGAIVQWHRVVGNNNRKGENSGNRYPYLVNAKFVDQLNDQLEYFEGVQLRGILLLVEERNLRKDSEGAKLHFDRYSANLQAQKQAIYTPRISSDLLISPFSGTMWCSTPFTHSGTVVTYDIVNGEVPIEAEYQVSYHVRTGGYSDWRRPTALEFHYLAESDALRTFTSLQQSGFDLSGVTGFDHLISSTHNRNWVYVGARRDGQVVSFPQNNPGPKAAVLPARTFKKDALATF